jgi:Ser/Thr protein kinase RdoA (MazF antagonist)
MDDQQAYLLNGLLARHFGLGRIVRFRPVARGRQATTYELLTAQTREYLAHVYPAAYDVDHLNAVARAVNALDAERFSVVPFLQAKSGAFAADGPQNTHMLVSLAPAGSVVAPADLTEHDVSQIGLRLAWMHRLLREHPPELPADPPLAERLRMAAGSQHFTFTLEAVETLLPLLTLPAAQGWAHGDIQSPALLLDHDHQIRTVMDWGLLHAGSPLEDVVDAFLSFCTDDDGRVAPDRGRMLLESYHSLSPIERVPWTPVVASWCAQRLLDNHHRRRPLPVGFQTVLRGPEHLVAALAGLGGTP